MVKWVKNSYFKEFSIRCGLYCNLGACRCGFYLSAACNKVRLLITSLRYIIYNKMEFTISGTKIVKKHSKFSINWLEMSESNLIAVTNPIPTTMSPKPKDVQLNSTSKTSLFVGIFLGGILLSVLIFVGFKRLDAIRRRREYRRMNDFLIDGMYNEMWFEALDKKFLFFYLPERRISKKVLLFFPTLAFFFSMWYNNFICDIIKT